MSIRGSTTSLLMRKGRSGTFPKGGRSPAPTARCHGLFLLAIRRASTRIFPLRLETVRLDFPFSYLASGGVSLRALTPAFAYRPIRHFERAMGPLLRYCAMFALIVVRRIQAETSPSC